MRDLADRVADSGPRASRSIHGHVTMAASPWREVK